MGWDGHDTVTRRLGKYGLEDHSLAKWDETSNTVVRQLSKYGFEDHSLARWDRTSATQS
jgi:hypothetical protein